MRLEIPQHWLFPTVCLTITFYFGYHSLQGAHGYYRMVQLREETKIANQIAEEVREQKNILSIKVQALKSHEKDQLKESAMRVLNMADSEDLIILD